MSRRPRFVAGTSAFASACLAVSLLAPVGSVAASETRSLLNCKNEFAGDLAVSDCLSLGFEESEIALSGLEESFLSLLSDAYPGEYIVNGDKGMLLAGSQKRYEAVSEGEEGHQLIAIIDGVPTPVKETIKSVPNADESASATVNPPAAVRVQAIFSNLASRFKDEPTRYRAYRDSRCAWLANMHLGVEALWKEISCQIHMNQMRVAELRTQMQRKIGHAEQPQMFRGLLRLEGDAARFTPCARDVDFTLSGSEEILASIERMHTASVNTEETPSYIEATGHVRSGELQLAKLQRVRARHADDCLLESDLLSTATVAGVAQPAPADHTLVPSLSPDADETMASANSGSSKLAASAPLAAKSALAELADSVQGSTKPAELLLPLAVAEGSLSGFFQSWVASCSKEQNRKCTATSEAEVASAGNWHLRIVQGADQARHIELVPASGKPVVGRDIGVYIDKKPVGNRRLKSRETRLKAGKALKLFEGQQAREMLRNMRRGRIIGLKWQSRDGTPQEVKFSLYGLRKAFEFFGSQSS